MNNILKHNDRRIKKLVDRILKKRTKEQTTLVVIDFDECVIVEHLSKLVTQSYKNRATITQEDIAGHGLLSIANLLNCYTGLTRQEFEQTIVRLIEKITWKSGAVEILKILSKEPFMLVFVSSGLEDAAKIACKAVGLTSAHFIACHLDFSKEDIILGPYCVTGDTQKGIVVRLIAHKGGFNKVISIGHGKGDIHLIKNGTEGFRFSLRDDPEAMAVADYTLENWQDLLNYI